VTARANEDGGFAGDLVKQQPVATKVAFAVVLEVSDERVIAVDRRHRLAFREQVDDIGDHTTKYRPVLLRWDLLTAYS